MLADPDPRATLFVVLGASDFPRSKLRPSEAFEHAANSVCLYFLSDVGFGLPIENFFTFFDSEYDPNTLDDQITTRIKTRALQLQATNKPATDLIVYYVGHGSFDEQKRYYLALRSTLEENQSVSSLRVDSLMTTLNNVGRALRKYVIIDACFAGEAAYSQSAVEDAVGQQIRRLPQKGTVFLCSSSGDLTSEFLEDGSNTLFSQALADSLWDGGAGLPPKLSFEQLRTVIEGKLITNLNRFIRPEIHTPDQPEGDIAKVALFPNGPRKTASLAVEQDQKKRIDAYLRNQADQQAKHAAKLSAEKQARDKEIRKQQLEEQRRKQSLQAQALRRYDSETEKRFREEAEDAQKHDLNQDLLVSWLAWKASESKVLRGALRQEAKEFRDSAATNRFAAANLWDNASKEDKSGSNISAALLRVRPVTSCGITKPSEHEAD